MNHTYAKLLTLALVCWCCTRPATAQDVYVNLENAAVQRFLDEVYYADQADSSLVQQYCNLLPQRLDQPQAAVVPLPATDAERVTVGYALEADFSDEVVVSTERGQRRVSVYNLVPQQSYYYRVVADGEVVRQGRIHTFGRVRMIHVPSVHNVRDMGGWVTADDRRIAYGRLYRGGTLNGTNVADSTDLATLRQLGVEAELDMRAWYNEGCGTSAFGFSSAAVGSNPPTYLYASDSGQLPEHLTNYSYLSKWRREFQFIVNNLRHGRTVYLHCVLGADRTGYLSLLLEGLLGVPYDGLMKDYELTSFSTGLRTKDRLDDVYGFIESLSGETMQQKFNTFFVSRMGVSQQDIDFFLSEMLEENTLIDVGIHEAVAPTGTASAVAYDLAGRRVSPQGQRRGLTIAVTADGRVRKVK